MRVGFVIAMVLASIYYLGPTTDARLCLHINGKSLCTGSEKQPSPAPERGFFGE